MKYKFTEFIYYLDYRNNKMAFMYSVLSGPRGGYYIIDEENTTLLLELLLARLDKSIIKKYRDKIVGFMSKDTVIRTIYSECNYTLKELANSGRYRLVHSDKGNSITQKIASNFSNEQLAELEKDVFEAYGKEDQNGWI